MNKLLTSCSRAKKSEENIRSGKLFSRQEAEKRTNHIGK